MKPTQEQVIEWAEESWIDEYAPSKNEPERYERWLRRTEVAFTLAYEAGRKDENEACAKVCELIAINAGDNRASECAAAIRARNEQ